MGNGIGKLCLCSAGGDGDGAGDISGRSENKFAFPSNQCDKANVNSICYFRPEPCLFSGDALSDGGTTFVPFRSVFLATVSANSSAAPSTCLDDSVQHSIALDSSASFESSSSFTSTKVSLLRAPRGFSVGGFGPSPRDSALNGSEPVEKQRRNFKKVLSRAFLSTMSLGKRSILKKKDNANARVSCSGELRLQGALDGGDDDDDDDDNDDDDHGDLSMECQNLHWAQGRAGEDRVHMVICEKHGWVFAGIYDGFNGPDATDYLLNNLFFAIHDAVKGLFCGHNSESELEEQKVLLSDTADKEKHPMGSGKSSLDCHKDDDVLQALSEALRMTEDAFLKNADEMIAHNPVLAMMGSCVLVMMMKGKNVYLMNVGDSRAVLATQTGNPLQLTMEHSTRVQEEVNRIRSEHPDDPSAVTNGRVKGYLNVTRAFGAGFLKEPKQNNAVLETFKVSYIGESPYITCSPSLHHHKLSPYDKFLILSSDGLYQFFTNEEAVAEVESFITMFPDRDPAQLLIEEALSRAAKNAGLELHELLQIPQGERRLYHDDISIVIISLEEGSIWSSSV